MEAGTSAGSKNGPGTGGSNPELRCPPPSERDDVPRFWGRQAQGEQASGSAVASPRGSRGARALGWRKGPASCLGDLGWLGETANPGKSSGVRLHQPCCHQTSGLNPRGTDRWLLEARLGGRLPLIRATSIRIRNRIETSSLPLGCCLGRGARF